MEPPTPVLLWEVGFPRATLVKAPSNTSTSPKFRVLVPLTVTRTNRGGVHVSQATTSKGVHKGAPG